ncbi:MAG: HlyD family efflux transporter periplasmic adaptor subunit [Bacteroidota bacterium]
MKYNFFAGLVLMIISTSCSNNENDYDASGNFEADEVIVSAQQTGVLLSLAINEGDKVKEGATVGQIDVTIPVLQEQQAQATIRSLQNKTSSAVEQNDLVKRQLVVMQAQLDQQLKEKTRTENLVKADAATRKQLDDITAIIDQLQKQTAVTKQQLKVNSSNTSTQNKSILSEKSPLEKTVEQYQELVKRGQVINPVTGIVLTKYALKGEMAMIGKPLYKIANIDTLTLKAYVTGDDLSEIKIGQQVSVRIDQGKKEYKNYAGTISWVSSKSEFTPKTIQTKDERANLVYAIKVRVKNDGFLKIGMYGEVVLKQAK